MTLLRPVGFRRSLAVLLERQQCTPTKGGIGKLERLVTGMDAVTSLVVCLEAGKTQQQS